MKGISDRCVRTANPFFCFVESFDGLTECCNSGFFNSLPFIARNCSCTHDEDTTQALYGRGDQHRQKQQRVEWQETTLDFLSWNAGPKRGEVTRSMVGSFHVIVVQEAQSHHHEIVTGAEQQFHIYQGAGQLILYNKSTFEAEGVKIQEEIQGTSM